MIDLTFLRHLMGGDEAMANRFLDLFRAEMPRQLKTLEDLLSAGDFAGAHVAAHAIKGQLQYLDQKDLANLALEIERQTEQEKVNRQTVEALQNGMRSLLKQLGNIKR